MVRPSAEGLHGFALLRLVLAMAVSLQQAAVGIPVVSVVSIRVVMVIETGDTSTFEGKPPYSVIQ